MTANRNKPGGKNIDSLLEVSPINLGESVLTFSISIGKFGGRREANYLQKNNDAGFFVFVIEGAFEVQGALLQARDRLVLWDTEDVEMEALSNDAIILVLELPLGKRDK